MSVKQALVLWQISPDYVLWTNPHIKVFPTPFSPFCFSGTNLHWYCAYLLQAIPEMRLTHTAVKKQSKAKQNKAVPSPRVFPRVSLCLSTITSWSFCFSSSLMPRLFTEQGKIRNFNGVWAQDHFIKWHRKEKNSQIIKPQYTTLSQK